MHLSERSSYWDNFKGILIFLVVFGHFLWEYRDDPLVGDIAQFIYIFHMPAFIFISGFFSKSKNCISFLQLLKLMVLFLLLNFSMGFYNYAAHAEKISLIHLYYSSWYLLAIFIYRLSLKFYKPTVVLLILSFIVSIEVGVISIFDNVFCLAKIVALYPFFLCGYLLTDNVFVTLKKQLDKRYWVILLSSLFLSVLYFFHLKEVISERDILWISYRNVEDIVIRIGLIIFSISFTLSLMILIPSGRVLFLSQWGKNSLIIYFLHRIFTLVLAQYAPSLAEHDFAVLYLFIISVLLTIILSSNYIAVLFNRCIDYILLCITGTCQLIYHRLPVLLFGVFTVTCVYASLPFYQTPKHQTVTDDSFWPVITKEQQNMVESSFKLSFVGDLILLRDMLYNSYDKTEEEYKFDTLFEYTNKYFRSDDLTIGVFEGPTAGAEKGYSTSNFTDGIPLYLNYPDSFADDVKASGIDLVTTANNHLLDMGVSGALRTIDVLNRANLIQVGSYKNKQDKQNRAIKIVEMKGLKFAILSYTYGTNYYDEAYFFNKENSHLTSLIVSPDSAYFEQAKIAVINDLNKAKTYDPDVIVVLPHMGTQFSHKADSFQETWTEMFINAGADIVLSDHSHAVQPIEWRKSARPGRKHAFVVYSPGNYLNSYTDRNGDAMAIVEVYLDKQSGEPVSSSIVPMWASSTASGKFQALPIIDIVKDKELQEKLSFSDYKRVEEVQKLVTSVMLGQRLNLEHMQERYYFFPDGYYRNAVDAIDLAAYRDSDLYKALNASNSVMFIGDSITAGTKNGGYGWYEPMMSAITDVDVIKQAWGGETAKSVLSRDGIFQSVADLYVIALGTNDVRYRSDKSSMTSTEYIDNLSQLVSKIKQKNEQAKFVFIGAWTTDHFDPVSVLDEKERRQMLEEYRQALQEYSEQNHHLYIDPNPAILDVLTKEYAPNYLNDHIHPNANRGIALYSKAVLLASP